MPRIELEPLSEEWRRYRACRITSTDVPGILGLSKWKTPLSVWRRIVRARKGEIVDDAKDDNPVMAWGRRMEPLTRAWTAEETGTRIEPYDAIAQHPDLDWLCATPDGVVEPAADLPAVREAEGYGNYEGKAPSQWTGKDWDEGVPTAYRVQNHVAMLCQGFDWGIVSALVQPDIRWQIDTLNNRFAESMIGRLQRFWDVNVMQGVEPSATGSDVDRQQLREMQEELGELSGWTELAGADVEDAYRLEALRDEIRQLEAEKGQVENRLQQVLGGYAFGVLPDGRVIGGKLQTREKYERVPTGEYGTPFRVLRFGKSLPKWATGDE